MSSFDEVFQRALACSSVTNELKLPREKGFWKKFFDQDASQQKYSIPMPPLLDSVSSTDRDPKRQKFEQKAIAETWRHCVKADAELSWTDKREADFQSALKRWLQTLLEMPKTFKVVELLPQQSTVERQLRMLRDLFWKKSPQTLKKSVHSLLRFMAFLNESLEPFPGTEPLLYEFLQNEKDSGAPTSRLQSVMQALSFLEHVLDVEEVSTLTRSKRCMGASSKLSNGPTRQADPFLVEHVVAFHGVLADWDSDPWDRFFAGSLLAMIYSRSRWNDLQQAEAVLSRIMETNQAGQEGTISHCRRGEISIYSMPTSCFHPEAGGGSKRLSFPRRLAATSTSGRQRGKETAFCLSTMFS